LDGNNRWVRMAALVPWAQVEQRYEKLFAECGMGALAIGATSFSKRRVRIWF
jgi:hypothetical protein